VTTSEESYGVLLFDEAFEHLSEVLIPYMQSGPIGKYICCRSFEENGTFADLTISPDLVDKRISETLRVSIPIRFVKFVATLSEANRGKLGFR
jgi:hypothetical protein